MNGSSALPMCRRRSRAECPREAWQRVLRLRGLSDFEDNLQEFVLDLQDSRETWAIPCVSCATSASGCAVRPANSTYRCVPCPSCCKRCLLSNGRQHDSECEGAAYDPLAIETDSEVDSGSPSLTPAESPREFVHVPDSLPSVDGPLLDRARNLLSDELLPLDNWCVG